MRPVFGMLIAGGLLLGPAIAVKAQNSGNAFGAYPAGITTGSPYGGSWSGFYGLNPGGYPLNTYSQPYNNYGSSYGSMAPGAPGTTYYNSSYGAPGNTTYGYAPSATTYGYGYGNSPRYARSYPSYSTGYAPAYGYNTYTRGGGLLRGGMFRGRR